MSQPASTFWTDASTVTGTVKQLPDRPLKHYAVIRANSGNGAAICVGGPDCFDTGLILGPGEQSPMLPIDNLNKLWVAASAGELGYSWIAM